MITEKELKSAGITSELVAAALNEDFDALLDETFSSNTSIIGSVVKGIIVGIDGDQAIVDVAMKAEGRISLREFLEFGKEETKITVGDEIEVYVESLDNINGEAILSRDKAKQEEALDVLEKAFEAGERVTGVIFGRVKGGFTVDLQGVLAFLPGSQVDVRPIRDMNPLMNTPLDFQVIKMSRKRGNIIVSRRSILDETRTEARDELLKDMTEGRVLEGVVKNITDYGAFIDLGGVDGLLHITDIAWHRINHPSEALNVGQALQVQVIRFNEDTKRVSLGLKQLNQDPWAKVEQDFPIGKTVTGKVTNITDYGAFIELQPGVEGLVHVSELSWTRKNVHPGKILSTSEEVEVSVLQINRDKRRISLSLKQCQENPWNTFSDKYPEGTEVEGPVCNITDFGIFITLTDDIDGLIHMSDLSWEGSAEEALKSYKKGDMVKAKVISIDADKERISLGVKQLSENPNAGAESVAKGSVVKATIVEIEEGAVIVEFDGAKGEIRKTNLSSDRSKQELSSYNVGDVLEAKVTQVTKTGKVSLSVKALEQDQEKQVMKDLASDNAGSSSLGDLLADAMNTKK